MLPWISRKLDMLDKTADVMKTFNDYSEEADIQFIQLTIPGKSSVVWPQAKGSDAAAGDTDCAYTKR